MGNTRLNSLPTTCRAVTTTGFGTKNYKIVLREDYPVPKVSEGRLLVRITHSGICHSDLHLFNGAWNVPEGIDCMGHEGAGEVAAIGEKCNPSWKVGDRVGVKPIWAVCGNCSLCRSGLEAHCENRVLTASHVNGTFCEYVLTDESYTTRLPDGVSNEIAAPFMCSGGTAFNAVKSCPVRAGQYLAVIGAGGGVGHMILQFARVAGLRVIALEAEGSKRQLCLELGAEEFVDVIKEDAKTRVMTITGGQGAHACIVVSGAKAAYSSAPGLLRIGGTMVCVGLPPLGVAIAGADPLFVCDRALTIKGISVCSMRDMDEALDMLARGLVTEHITKFPFSQFQEAVDRLLKGDVAGRMVVEFNKKC